jgi:hypothetical protein
MSQLFRDLDFALVVKAPILVGAMIVQFNLEHSGLLCRKTSKTVTLL